MSDDQQPAAVVIAREGIVDDTDDHRSVSQIDGRSYYDVSETGRPILHLTTPASPLAAGLSMEPRFVSNTEQLVNQNRTQLWNADNFETDLDKMIQRGVERILSNAAQARHAVQQRAPAPAFTTVTVPTDIDPHAISLNVTASILCHIM